MFELEVSKQMHYVAWKHNPITKAITLVKRGSRVLDVGCSYGYVGKELAKKNCEMYGIETDPDTARAAATVYQRVCSGDVEKGEIDFSEGFFDYILCLDVLEHLVRPDIALRKLQPLLKNDGCLVVSLPNVARIEHRLQLLLGKFDYDTTGALSQAHLRFFTKKTACRLVEEAGFRIQRIVYTGFASIVPLFPTLTSFQFLILAGRKDATL